MRRVRGLAVFAAVILVPLAAVAGQGPSAPREGTVLTGAVTSVRVVPGTGRADVVIAVDGAVDVMDFTLEAPHRIVVDVKGATLRVPVSLYDKTPRGGITNVRLAQYREDLVRVVLDMDARHEYTVARGDHDVRISVTGPDAFTAWQIGGAAPAVGGGLAARAASPEAAPPKAEKQAERDVEKVTPAPVVPPRVAPEPQSQEPRISVTFADVNIREVLGTFASFAHRTIVQGKAVDGTVNATIDDQPWDVALKSILNMQGLSAVEDSTGIISVDSYQNIAARALVEPMQTQVIEINYANAELMSNTVRSLMGAGCGRAAGGGGGAPVAGGAQAAPPAGGNEGLGAGCNMRGSVSFDAKTNTVIVTETPARLADITSYVRDLDVRTPQVTIKAKIIAVDLTRLSQLGLSYGLGSGNTLQTSLTPGAQSASSSGGTQNIFLAGDGLAAVANATRPYSSSAALSLIYNMTLGGFNLTSFLDALASEQLTDVQAEPSVTTVNNKEATLFAGSNLAFLLTPPIIPGQIATAAPQIQRQDIGITLRVTPHVTSNRQIVLDVFAEQQTLVTVTVAGPSTNKRNSTNQVLVSDGETAVIGGLTQTEVSKTRTGIPFLMTLPGIGKLFSQEQIQETKQDLLILITPHIVDDGEVVRPPRKP